MYDADKPILVTLIIIVGVLFGLLATGAIGGSVISPSVGNIYPKKIRVAGVPLQVEVADTPEKKITGLSGRDKLPENQGMLFVFETLGKYPIWMKDMKFPLDVYWINSEGIIVDMWRNAYPSSYPQVFEPAHNALYILEVVAGFAEVYNIEIGDSVTGL